MITSGLFTSNTPEWETPQDFFDALDEEFRFDLDIAANDDNHKCVRYYTKEMDGLANKANWGGMSGVILRMGERLANGLRLALNMPVFLSCFSQLGLTLGGSMTIYTRILAQRLDSSRAVLNLERARILRLFQVWW